MSKQTVHNINILTQDSLLRVVHVHQIASIANYREVFSMESDSLWKTMASNLINRSFFNLTFTQRNHQILILDVS